MADARAKVAATGLIWAVCYSERLQNEAGVFGGRLIEEGAIGRVLQVIGTCQLFKLEEDPRETRDRAEDPGCRETRDRLLDQACTIGILRA